MRVNIDNLTSLNSLKFDELPEEENWSFDNNKEYLMHKIHIYPAKFPSLIARKAIEYADEQGLHLDKIGDVFGGCGTVALEAKTHGIDFWGTDINPVASLIANAKIDDINLGSFNKYFDEITSVFYNYNFVIPEFKERLKYWFDDDTYIQLYALKCAIENVTPKGKYRRVYNMLFSSILKKASRWLSKSIKPQIDPNKKKTDVYRQFTMQATQYRKALQELQQIKVKNPKIKIENKSVLNVKKENFLDAIITSPPYVTSYEYADLHQLSSLWLGYTDDYTKLREDSIGSLYHLKEKDYTKGLNCKSLEIITNVHFDKRKQILIARYYHEMTKVIEKCWHFLKEKGIVVLVIGNTEYKGVNICNAESIAEMLLNKGFKIIEISKRKVNNKFLPSYRDENGKFTSEKKDSRKIYSQEYVIIAKKGY